MDKNRRFYLRIYPSKTDPVKLAFKEGELKKVAPYVQVRDISIGGIGLELSDSVPQRESLFLPGTRIDEIGITLPFEGPCIFSGVVRFMYEALRGVEFLLDHVEQKKVARYIYMREMEMLGRNTSKWVREPEAGLDGKRYGWMTEPEAGGEGNSLLRHTPGKKKILVIDPSPARLGNYCLLLSSCESFEVYSSDCGKAAETALQIKPDLILMDLSEPDPEGLQGHVMKRLKRYPVLSTVPIFMVATGNRREAVLTAMRYGADDFIIKTAGEDLVLSRIKEFFRQV